MSNTRTLPRELRMVIWMNMPSHHQSAFFREIVRAGVDLIVCYYAEVDAKRLEMGWGSRGDRTAFEMCVPADIHSLEMIDDWRDRIHIVPGYGCSFLRKLAKTLSKERVRWAHWSEMASPGLSWYLTYPVKAWYATMVNRYAIGALAVGKLAADDFAKWGIRRNKIEFLPYSPEIMMPSDGDDGFGLSSFIGGRRCFLYVGRLESGKGTDVLLKAFAALANGDDSDDWVLVLVGKDMSNGRYIEYVNKCGLDCKVMFLGVVPSDTIGSVYRIADVLILPSRYDGWGAVVNEASAHGKALIVSDRCGAAYHLVSSGQNGYMVRAGSWSDLAKAMRTYIADPKIAGIHGEQSRTIYNQYSPINNARRLIDTLNSWISGKMREELHDSRC